MFTIEQVTHILSRAIIRNLYFALIHPHPSYGILVWENANQTILRKTEIRILNKAAFSTHTDSLFRSQISKLDDLHQYISSLFIFDYVINNLPISLN